MESNEAPLDTFDLGDSTIVASELSSRAWIYLKKVNKKKEESFQTERGALLETCAVLSKTIDLFAVELGLLSHEISRAIGRQEKREGDLEELSYLKNKLDTILKKLDVSVEDPTGESIRDELVARCEVLSNTTRPNINGHVVGETLSPIISYRNKVIHLAEVIGWIGE